MTFEINRLNELHVQYIKAELRGFWIKKKIKVIVNPQFDFKKLNN